MPNVDATTRLGLRTQLVFETGYYHLVGTQSSGGDTVPDYTDDQGADYYLDTALRWLERECKHKGKRSKVNVSITGGDDSFDITARNVSGIRLTDDDDFLTQVTEDWLFETYGADLTAVSAVATPLYWAFKTGAAGAETQSVWIMPPPAADKTAEVYGHYWSVLGSGDSATNWWTVNFHDVILYIAMRLVNKQDLNVEADRALMDMIETVKRAIWTEDIMDEIQFFGDTIQG